ncbi:MAG: hypothetical protein AB7E60_06935 [Sphingobium sp.]
MRVWICLLPLMAGACAGTYEPRPLTDKQALMLEKAIAGMTPGEKVSCIPRSPSTNMTVISGNVLLYRANSRLIYRNDLIGSCNGLERGDTMIVRSYTAQQCRGDMITSADLPGGMVTGSCALGDFTPYRK